MISTAYFIEKSGKPCNAEENRRKLLIQPIRIINIPRGQSPDNIDFSELTPSYENVMKHGPNIEFDSPLSYSDVLKN